MANRYTLLHLEGLRGVAALLVVIHHFEIGSLLNNRFTQNSWLMVDFFFVLSGFVIARSYRYRIKHYLDLTAFQIKRFRRLYPLHLVVLSAFLGWEIVKWILVSKTELRGSGSAFDYNNLETFAQNIAMLQVFFYDGPTWNYPSWSISAEFFTYAIFGILVFLLHSTETFLKLAYLVIVTISMFVVAAHGMDAVSVGFFRCTMSFFVGAAIVEFALPRAIRFHSFVSVVLLSLVLLVVAYADILNPLVLLGYPLLVAFLIVVLNSIEPGSYLVRILSCRWLVALGAVSYTIYMTHALFLKIYRQILIIFFDVNTTVNSAGFTKLSFDSIAVATFVQVLGIGIILFAAPFIYRQVELRFTENNTIQKGKKY